MPRTWPSAAVLASRSETTLSDRDVHPDYRALLAQVPAILYIADAGDAGRWHYVSPQIRSILGFSPRQWCADPHLWEQRLHPADRDQVLANETRYVAEARVSEATEYRMLHRDGRVVWIRDDALLVRDRTGRPRWHGILSNITERKLAEVELEQRAAQQAAVARLGEHALEGASTSELMQEAVLGAAEMLGVEVGAVLELMPDRGHFVLRSGYGWPDSGIGEVSVPLGTASQAGYTILKGGPIVVSDWSIADQFSQSPVLRKIGTRSGLTVAIEGRKGPFGVLGVHAMEPREYSAGDVDFVQSLANVLADAIARQATEDQIRHRALHDPLTGLPNRVLFLDRLGQALVRQRRRRSMIAILFLDLDSFKLVNDSLGHQVGDELLAAIAPRLKQALRESDTVARFGGDEFAVLLEDISGEQEAVEMATRIGAVLARPFVLAGGEHFVTTSVGIAMAQGGEVAEAMIRDADAAMYRAKDRGKARYELFDEVMRERAIARLRVETDLRRALDRCELRLDYQPVVSLRDGRIVGVEALLRWDHPERGMIEPGEFIPVAEESGLIEPIGRWVLERACRQAVHWYRLQPDSAPIGISVNLSAVQCTKRGLAELVLTALRNSGLEPSCLSLEITETVMLADADGLAEVLQALKATGVKLVLDDFGTGYSSLGYLTRLPLDTLKVDRSFIAGLSIDARDTAITEAIVAMSHALSLDVVGEGVETALQVQELRRLGCDLAQGFYFAPPVTAEAITNMLQEGPAWLEQPLGLIRDTPNALAAAATPWPSGIRKRRPES